jgi:hypothetical protein
MAKLSMSEAQAMLGSTPQEDYYEVLFGLTADGRIDYEIFQAAVDAANESVREDLAVALELCDAAAEFILCEHEDHADQHYDDLCMAVDVWVGYEDGSVGKAEDMN